MKCGVIPLPKDIDVIVSRADIIKFKLWNEIRNVLYQWRNCPMRKERRWIENDSGIHHLRLVFPRVFVKDLAKDGARFLDIECVFQECIGLFWY